MKRAERPAARATDAHKGTAGRVLVIAGSRWMPGAAALCATGALRGGAGLVTLASRSAGVLDHAIAIRPELLLWHLPDALDLDELGSELEERRFDAVVIGPGLRASNRVEQLVEAVLSAWSGPLVLDAGALSIVAADPALAHALRARKAMPAIVTPHPGEAARLLGRELRTDDEGRRADAIDLALHLGAVAVLKGAGTQVVDPTGERTWRNSTGNPGMATGGTGDVLAGLMGALIADVDEPHELWHRAKTAVYWHGLAGDRAAKRLGERALLASDLADELGPAELKGPWA